jgi:hypothetical protein
MYLVYQAAPASPAASPQAPASAKMASDKSGSPDKSAGTGANPKAVTEAPAQQNGETTAQTVSPDAPPLPTVMNPILWIGLGFLAGLVMFLGFTIYKPPPRGSQGRETMRILSALCCGFAAGFLTGAAIFNATFTHAFGKVGISGSAGIALFLTVFFFYDKVADKGLANVPNGVTVTIVLGWTFRDVANLVATLAQSGMDYQALNEDELGADMRPQPVTSTSWELLLESLRNITVKQAIRPYTVTKQAGSYVFKI